MWKWRSFVIPCGKGGGWRRFEAAEDSLRICSLPKGEQESSWWDQGVLPLLDFLSVPLCPCLNKPWGQRSSCTTWGGGLEHIPCAGGWDWAPVPVETRSRGPGGGIASELGTGGTWWEKKSKNFFPDALLKGWGLSKGAEELDYPLGKWDFFLSLVSTAEKKNHFILLFSSSVERGHIYPAFNHLWWVIILGLGK